MSLEKSFKKEFKKNQKEIDSLLKEAREKIQEAIILSEKSGIPFSAYFIKASNKYIPTSFSEKWGKLDQEILQDYEIYIDDYPGWQHSFC